MTDKKGSGRTPRMVQYAVQRAREGKKTVIMANNFSHATVLSQQVKKALALPEDEASNLLRTSSFSFVLNGNWWSSTTGKWTNYDFAANTFAHGAPETEYLIDHFALERILGYVTGYLAAMNHIKDHNQWLIDTSRVLAELGRRVYLVTDDEEERIIAREVLNEYNVSVESPTDLENFDPLSLCLKGAHPNCQLLADPEMIRRMFAGSLNEMKRWDQ